VGALGLDSDAALVRLAEQDVGLSLTPHPGVLRALTHLDVDDDAVDVAIERIPKALGVLARA
jgi:threonine aldolase